MEYKGKYVSLKEWARKDNHPFGASNLYYVCRETEKGILVSPVDTWKGWEDYTFWTSKKAATIVEL